MYQNRLVFTKWQLERLFGTSAISIGKCAKSHTNELKGNDYIILRGEELESFLVSLEPRKIKSNIKHNLDILRIKGLELFTFKALLNLAMLLPESKTAKFIRHRILDIAIDTVAERDNCHTKYVNRSIKYIFPAVMRRYYSCSIAFQSAVDRYIESSVSVYKNYTGQEFKSSAAVHYDRVYELIFGDKHEHYRQYLGQYTSASECNREKDRSKSRFRTYSLIKNRLRIVLCQEIQQAITNIENLLAEEIKSAFKQQNRKIKFKDLDRIVSNCENDRRFKPFIESARAKIATVDLLNSNAKLLRDILSQRRQSHFKNIADLDLHNVLTAKSKSLKEKLSRSETLGVFQRLSDR